MKEGETNELKNKLQRVSVVKLDGLVDWGEGERAEVNARLSLSEGDSAEGCCEDGENELRASLKSLRRDAIKESQQT